MPSERAAAFMRSTKAGRLPPTRSPRAWATSLADLTMMILSAVSTVITVPGLNPIFEGGCLAAAAVITTPESPLISPAAMADSVT